MIKSHALESIEQARLAHINEMHHIELLLKGKKNDKLTSLSKVQCNFGKWLYDDNQHVKKLLGLQFYGELDATHEMWHVEYARIYNIFFNKEKEKGLISKLFSSSKIDSLELDKAKLYYEELNETTQKLLHILDKSKRRLEALNESKFT